MDIVKHISSKAEQLLGEYGLGKVQGEYTEGFVKKGLIFVAFLPVGCIMLASTLPTLLAPHLTSGDWWQRLGNLSSLFIGGSCLSLFGLMGILLLGVTFWRGEMRLYLGEKGFISVRRQIETVVRWEPSAEIRKQILFVKGKSENVPQITSICSYTITPIEGKACSFNAEPGPTIEEMVTASQLPRMLEDYAQGKTLAFGWLALDHKGLSLTPEQVPPGHPTRLAKLPSVARTSQMLLGTCVASGEHFLPWTQLTCYWVDESRSTLILSKHSERKHWAIVPLYQIANPSLCLALLEQACYGDTRAIPSCQEKSI